ncbi:MAG: hypothetical protein QM733_23335 [Ilumatobacteraceae bacterium]
MVDAQLPRRLANALVDLGHDVIHTLDLPDRNSPSSPVTLVTAEALDGRVVGLVALILLPSLVEPVGAGRMQCQMKELFVSRSARSGGVGEAPLRWSARFAARSWVRSDGLERRSGKRLRHPLL